jgi:hypothetical protein
MIHHDAMNDLRLVVIPAAGHQRSRSDAHPCGMSSIIPDCLSGPHIDELVDLARQGRVGLWITEAFTVDQETAPPDKAQLNLAWLSQQPVIGRIPGPWRLGYSGLEGPDGFTDDDHAAADLALREIILPEELQRGRLDEHDPAQLAATATRSPTSSTSPPT